MMTSAFFIRSCQMVALMMILSGCSHPEKQYWQRTNTSQSVYMYGPKAQQMLHRDIQNCVNELKELERLHQIKDPIPMTFDGYVKEADPATLYGVKNQNGESALFSGSDDYANLDGCMYAKGWERIRNLPYSITGSINGIPISQNPRRDRPDPATMRDIPRPPQYENDAIDYQTMNP